MTTTIHQALIEQLCEGARIARLDAGESWAQIAIIAVADDRPQILPIVERDLHRRLAQFAIDCGALGLGVMVPIWLVRSSEHDYRRALIDPHDMLPPADPDDGEEILLAWAADHRGSCAVGAPVTRRLNVPPVLRQFTPFTFPLDERLTRLQARVFGT